MINQEMQRRKREIQYEIRKIEKRLASSPEGTLIVNNCRGQIQFYNRTNPNDIKGKYIPKENRQLIKDLAQKEYDQKALRLLKQEFLNIEKFLDNSKENEIQTVYNRMHPLKRPFVKAMEMDDESYAQWWLSRPLETDSYMPEKKVYPTKAGIKVRSQAEQTIANTLFDNGIPFKYEPKVETICQPEVYPDFYILNKRTRQTFYLEYLGLMDDQSYRNKLLTKLYSYSTVGIVEGKNLMLLFGIPIKGVDIDVLETMIKEVFL